MSRRPAVTIVALVVMMTLVVCAMPDAALAASKIGKNIGSEVKSWGSALLLGTASLVGLPALAKRDFNESLLIAGIVLLLGGFLFAGPTVKNAIEGVWTSVGA